MFRNLYTFLFFSIALSSITYANSEIEINYREYTLDNGLRLIVHEDNKAPIVAVNVWYHVGSKNEVIGKTGFAHLFEHLMFNGSENYNDEYFKPFERVGATNMNGTTYFDRTNYFENVGRKICAKCPEFLVLIYFLFYFTCSLCFIYTQPITCSFQNW